MQIPIKFTQNYEQVLEIVELALQEVLSLDDYIDINSFNNDKINNCNILESENVTEQTIIDLLSIIVPQLDYSENSFLDDCKRHTFQNKSKMVCRNMTFRLTNKTRQIEEVFKIKLTLYKAYNDNLKILNKTHLYIQLEHYLLNWYALTDNIVTKLHSKFFRIYCNKQILHSRINLIMGQMFYLPKKDLSEKHLLKIELQQKQRDIEKLQQDLEELQIMYDNL